MNPILIGQAEVIDLVQPQVRKMLDAAGFYIGGDTKNPDMNVPLVSMDGRVFSMVVDNELNPERFLETLTLKGPFRGDVETFDLVAHLHRQRDFSARTFGPGTRTAGVLDHIRKELNEIEAKPDDVTEWVDVILLALDGAWRAGFSPEQIAQAIAAKQAKNEARQWPDWRTAEPGKAIEHIKGEAAQAGPALEDEATCDQCIELAEELVWASVRKAIAGTRTAASLLEDAQFRGGMETACEEIETRLGLASAVNQEGGAA